MATTPTPLTDAAAGRELPVTDHEDCLEVERAYLDARGGAPAAVADKAFQ